MIYNVSFQYGCQPRSAGDQIDPGQADCVDSVGRGPNPIVCRGVFSFIPGAWGGDLEVVLAIRPDLELELDGVSRNRVIEDSPS